jgi:glucosamine--fructose-6-phosphate aminotransferase (isomerizing)
VLSITREKAGLPDSIETVPKESSETYTVSYTATLLILARLAAALGTYTSEQEIAEIAYAVRAALDDPGTGDIPIPRRAIVFSGAGPASVTAREGALKVREASRFIAEGYDAEYLLHGHAVPLGTADRLVLLSPPADPDGFLEAMEPAAQGAGVPVDRVKEPSDLPPLLAQIPLTVRLQMLALRFATERRMNPDTVITGTWDDERLWTLGRPAEDG